MKRHKFVNKRHNDDSRQQESEIKEREEYSPNLKGIRRSKDIIIQALTDGQKTYINKINDNRITFCIGPAGSGKTACAVGIALKNILDKKPTYKKLVVIRPIKEACGEHLGFLPGGLDEKLAPWLQPVVDNMLPFLSVDETNYLIKRKMVEVMPLAYARGRSLNDCFIILDEAQNCSKKQMKMALTRLGKNSKMVVNGDITQMDSEEDDEISGVEDAMNRLKSIENISMVILHKEDIVRDKLVGQILERYQD